MAATYGHNRTLPLVQTLPKILNPKIEVKFDSSHIDITLLLGFSCCNKRWTRKDWTNY